MKIIRSIIGWIQGYFAFRRRVRFYVNRLAVGSILTFFRMIPLSIRRMRQEWKILAILLFAISLVTGFLALGPLYIRGVNEVDLRFALDNADPDDLRVSIISDQPLGAEEQDIIQGELGGLITDIDRFQRSDYTAPQLGQGQAPGLAAIATRGYVYQIGQNPFGLNFANPTQNFYQPFAFDDLAERVTVVEGRLPRRTPPPAEVSGQGLSDEEQDQLELGYYNRAQVEAVVTRTVAEEAEVEVGTRFYIGNIFLDGTGQLALVNIVGIVEPVSPDDSFWNGNTMFLNGAEIDIDNFGTTRFDYGLAFEPASYEDWIAGVVPGTSYFWRMDTDPSIVNADNTNQVTTGLNSIRSALRSTDPTAQVVSGYSSLLAGFGGRVETAEGPINFLSGAVLVLLLYHLVTTVSLVLQQQGREWSTITSRGGSTLQLFSMQFFAIAVLGIISFGAAFIISRLFMLFMQEFGPLSNVLGNASLTNVPLPTQSIWLAGAGAVAATIALSLPSIPAAAQSLLRLKQGTSRPPTRPAWSQYFLDFVFLGGSLLFIGRMYVNSMPQTDFFEKVKEAWRLLIDEPGRAVETIADNIGGTNGLNDPLNLLGMALFVTGMALLWLRFFPMLVGLISRFTSSAKTLTTPLAVWNVERDPGHYSQLVLLLIGTLALGTASIGLSATRDRGAWQVAERDTGGAVRVELDPNANLVDRVAWDRLDGVDDHTRVMNTTVVPVREGSSNQQVQVIGVDAEAFAAAFPQFAAQVETLKGAPQLSLPGTPLDIDATALEVQVWSEEIGDEDLPEASVAINAYVLDAAGVPFIVRLTRPVIDTSAAPGTEGTEQTEADTNPPTPTGTWVTLSGDLPQSGRSPYYLWQIGIASRQGNVSSFNHTIYLDLFQTRDSTGVARQLEGFEATANNWLNALSQEPYVIESSQVATTFESVIGGVEMAMVNANQAGIDPIVPDSPTVLQLDYTIRNVLANISEPSITINPVTLEGVPAVISPAFAKTFSGSGVTASRGRQRDLQVGDVRPILLNVGSGTVNVGLEITNIVDDFPTVSENQDYFVILPLDTARLWFNQAARPRNFFDVNQVWLDLPEREASETLIRDLESTEGINRVVYAYDRYGQILREPLPSAIAGMLFAGFWISLALSLLDFAFYIAVTAQQRSFTFGVLRSLGWNANNIWRLLLVEQITLVTPALIVGSILGAALAYLILPFLSLVGNETLRLPVGDVGSLIASLIVAFSILLVFAAFFLRRMSVNQVLRLGEE